jgi:hypothetical protein
MEFSTKKKMISDKVYWGSTGNYQSVTEPNKKGIQ